MERREQKGWGRDALTIVREIRGSPEEVFRRLTDPAGITQWWGGRGGLMRAHVNLRPGGEYRFDFGGAPGETRWIKGQYQAVEPSRHLVMTWFSSGHPELRNSVEIRLDPVAGGTRITVVHSGLAGRPDVFREYEKEWPDILDLMAARA
jgi:uncharacterized protein YndB with AHSA1/START domain